MDAILKGGEHNAFYITNENTLNTPYKHNIVSFAAAVILSIANEFSYGHQFAYIIGSTTLYRTLDKGNIGEWIPLATAEDLANYLPLSGGNLNDNIAIVKNDYPGYILNTHGGDNNFACGLWNSPNGGIYLQARKDGRNRLLFLNDNSVPIQNAIMMWYYDDGNEHNAVIFGQHNTSLLASTIERLIQTGELKILDEATNVTLRNIETTIQQNYAEAQQEAADSITLELLERGVI